MSVVASRVQTEVRLDWGGGTWRARTSALDTIDLFYELERRGIDIGREFTIRADLVGEVVIATQEPMG